MNEFEVLAKEQIFGKGYPKDIFAKNPVDGAYTYSETRHAFQGYMLNETCLREAEGEHAECVAMLVTARLALMRQETPEVVAVKIAGFLRDNGWSEMLV